MFVILQLFAFWPSWQWYLERMSDGSDEPWGIVALGCALFLTISKGRAGKVHVAGSSLSLVLTLVYALSANYLSALPRAIIAVTALSFGISSQRFGRFIHFGLLGLLILSLPVIASLQFYAGFPIRALTTHCTSILVSLLGYPVQPEGTVLRYFGEVVAVDAPCAGIKMLWSSLLLHFALSAFGERNFLVTWYGYALTNLLVFVFNVFRTTILFFTESGIVLAPSWAHQAIGLICFSAVSIAVIFMHSRFAKSAGSAWRLDSAPNRGRLPSAYNLAFSLVFLFVGISPFVTFSTVQAEVNKPSQIPVVNWPKEFRGEQLFALPLSDKEQRFSKDFPGQIARFSDGEHEILIRFVTRATRKLHPSRDCLRGAGYTVEPLPVLSEGEQNYWSCVRARKNGKAYRVCEQIKSRDGTTYSDVSTWFWSAAIASQEGPWFAYTVSKPEYD